jgi:hypothetical protein
LRRDDDVRREAGSVGSDTDPVTFEDLVAVVSTEFGPEVGRYVQAHGSDIVAKFAGHFDCYLAAMRTASRQRTEPDNPHGWCRKVGLGYIANGIPPESVSLAKGKARKVSNPFSKILAEMGDD